MKATLGRLRSWLWPSVSEPALAALTAYESRKGICKRFATSLANRQPDQEIDKNVLKAVSRFSHFRWRSSAALAGMLGQARLEGERKDRAVDALLAALTRLPVRAINWPLLGVQYTILSLPLILPPAMILIMDAFAPPHRGPGHEESGWILVSVLIVACYCLLAPFAVTLFVSLYASRVGVVTAAAAYSLGELQDPRALPALAHAAHDNREQVRLQSLKSLQKLLPAVLASDLNELDFKTTIALCMVLNEVDEGAVRTSLAILERAGDERALSAIAKLAASQSSAASLLAANVLATIEKRCVENRIRSQMLRPSARDAGVAELLRPASTGGAMEAEQLLRAHE